MAEPLLGSPGVVMHWDDDLGAVSVIASSPGPAGSLVVELGGMVVAVDGANPSVLNSLEVFDAGAALADPATAQLLARLLDRPSLDALQSVVERRPRRPVRVEGRGNSRFEVLPIDMASLMIASSTSESPGLRRMDIALATIEALTLAAQLGLTDHIADAHQLMSDALIVLSDEDPTSVSEDRGTQLQAAHLFDRATHFVDDIAARRLQVAARALREPPRDVTELAMGERFVLADDDRMAVARARRAAVASSENVFLADSLPLAIAGTQPTFRRTDADEYQVRLAGWAGRADGWWVRAFDGNDFTPLAMVPMGDQDSDVVADLLIPVAYAGEVRLDIVDDPTSPRPSEQFAAFRGAIGAGQRAARQSRLRRRDEAEQTWMECSQLHSAAGDRQRARMARTNGQGIGTGRPREPLVMVPPTLGDELMPG